MKTKKQIEYGSDTCCLCGAKFYTWPNNAQPVMDGECCDKCNLEVVIPRRMVEGMLQDISENPEKHLQNAIDDEQYEMAAILRDYIPISQSTPEEFAEFLKKYNWK